MALTAFEFGRTMAVLMIAGLLLLVLSACEPHRELKSPCHVVAVSASPDCIFTPINTGAV